MLPRTLRNRLNLMLVNCSKQYLRLGMLSLGLLPLLPDGQGRIVDSPLLTGYSVVVGLLFSGLYVFFSYDLQSEPSVQKFYEGVSRVTLAIQCLVSFWSILCFYSVAVLSRKKFTEFYKRMIQKYKTYGCFYTLVIRSVTYRDLDGQDELDWVYVPLFVKGILVHFCTLLFIGAVSYRNWVTGQTPMYKYLGFFIVPYMVQSLTTSFLYQSALRTSFKYQRMDEKLVEIRKQLQGPTRSQTSAHGQMSRCCEISDLVDGLAQCYGSVSGTAEELVDLYKFQLIFCLLFCVINTLHRLFVLYMAVDEALANGNQLDVVLLLVNVTHVLLGVVELVLVVNVTELCHWGSLRVGRTLQRLIYFEGLDIRLRHSIENFSLCGMHRLDPVIGYLVILIQFYHMRN